MGRRKRRQDGASIRAAYFRQGRAASAVGACQSGPGCIRRHHRAGLASVARAGIAESRRGAASPRPERGSMLPSVRISAHRATANKMQDRLLWSSLLFASNQVNNAQTWYCRASSGSLGGEHPIGAATAGQYNLRPIPSISLRRYRARLHIVCAHDIPGQVRSLRVLLYLYTSGDCASPSRSFGLPTGSPLREMPELSEDKDIDFFDACESTSDPLSRQGASSIALHPYGPAIARIPVSGRSG